MYYNKPCIIISLLLKLLYALFIALLMSYLNLVGVIKRTIRKVKPLLRVIDIGW